jgi:hypothetical protein
MSSSSTFTPQMRAHCESSACSASMNAAVPPLRWTAAAAWSYGPEASGKTTLARIAADAEGQVERDRSARDRVDLLAR